MAACRSSSENTRKMSLIPVSNKNSPRAHTESELDVLGVHRKLVKYVESELDVLGVHRKLVKYVESELDVLGVHGKLVKYVVQLSKRIN
jgi:hypothetical protein